MFLAKNQTGDTEGKRSLRDRSAQVDGDTFSLRYGFGTREKVPTSKFEHLHTINDHILFLTDMLPNLKFNGYNKKFIRDQYECLELGPDMKFLYGENADDHELLVDKATTFYILAFVLTNGVLIFTHECYQKLVLPEKYRHQLLYEVHNFPLR